MIELVADVFEYLVAPSTWPKLVRRAFVLTIPLSGPIYVVCVLSYFLTMMILAFLFLVIALPISWLIELWD
jgi:uncharacterized metal-binding protein